MSDAVAGCFHCGETLPLLPLRLDIAGETRAVCCAGCAAAACWIRDNGLGQYYQLRQADAARVNAGAQDYSDWMDEDLLAEHARAVPGGLEITVLSSAMRCAACAWLVGAALHKLPGTIEASANALSGRIRLQWNPQQVALSTLLQQLDRLGYAPSLAAGGARECETRRLWRRDVLRLGLAGLGAMQAMMFAEALYLDNAGEMSVATRDFLRWITLLVATPVVFVAGWPFLAGLARGLRRRQWDMDVLVGSSVLLAYGFSLVETLRGGPQVWFDAAVMFVFLLLAARQLESWVRRRACAQVDALARARPALALREGADGMRERIALGRVRPGDVLQVDVGEVVPADGELLDSAASLDEALLSGEALPVLRQPGETLAAGSLCRGAPLRLRVLRTGADTRLAELTRLVGRAQEQRPRLARVADRVARHFIAALFVAAVLVFALWWRLQPGRAFEVALAMLVISCPCALSLAIPAALAAAHDSLARRGVLALRPDALETLARLDVFLLDKTGSLTTAQPVLDAVQTFGRFDAAQATALAAALQCDASHPLAAAFGASTVAPGDAQQRRLCPGQGVEGLVDGIRYRLGRADFAAARDDDGAIWLGDGNAAIARFSIRQQLRDDAIAAVAELRAQGVRLELASGDGAAAVAEIATALGIADWRARQSAQDKLARARELQRQGHVVGMLGDGINDAPILAGADVSFAFAGGAALTHRAADFVLTGTRLLRIAEAIALARQTRRIVRQNLAWALAYNAVALPFAACGLVSPALAALGMTASSLLVLLNALRLLRPAP